MPKRKPSPSPAATRASKRKNTTGSLSGNHEDVQMADRHSQVQAQKSALSLTGARITPAVQKKVQLAAKNTPRYLFRVWRGQEDGKLIESNEAIVPRKFSTHDAPQSMFDVSKKLLAKDVKENLRGHQTPSLFSDWTHSFHAVLEKAGELYSRTQPSSDDDIYLCILDVKALPGHVTVLHTSDLALIDRWIPTISAVDHKFMAYGIIPESAYSAVEYGQFCEDDTLTWLRAGVEHFTDFDAELNLAMVFGSSFGIHFELPLVVTCLAMYRHNADVLTNTAWRNKLAKRLRQLYDVPADWEADPSIMTDIACMNGYKDAMRTRAVMRAMVQHKLGTTNTGRPLSRKDSVSDLAELIAAETLGDEEEDSDYESDVDVSLVPQNHLTPDDHMSDDNEPERSAISLPRGAMDEKTKRELQQATHRTPRYLFRAWNNSDSPSGGYVGLNTPTAITPLAYDKRRNCGRESIYEHSRDSLTNMALGHLQSSRSIATEFSSWGASLQVAFHFTRANPNAYISVIDTRKLPKNNVVLHVPSLDFLNRRCSMYDWEYLAHGVITGPALSTVPVKAFKDIGLPAHFGRHGLRYVSACSSTKHQTITSSEVKDARLVADQYGPAFRVAVTLAILCLKQRCGDFWDCGNIKNLEVIAEGLQDCRIPQHWCRDMSILTDVVYTAGYGEVKQMIYLLRALVDYYHGRGARGRSRSRARSMSRPNRYMIAGNVRRLGGEKSVRFVDVLSDEERRRGRRRTRPIADICVFRAEDAIL